jgi:hypothetical protein
MSRRVIGWFTGVLTVCGAAEALAINNVDAGWGWDIGATALTLACAFLAGRLAYQNAPDPTKSNASTEPLTQAPGSVVVEGRVKGGIQTLFRGLAGAVRQGTVIGAGAVRVSKSGKVGGDIKTVVEEPGATSKPAADKPDDGTGANGGGTS